MHRINDRRPPLGRVRYGWLVGVLLTVGCTGTPSERTPATQTTPAPVSRIHDLIAVLTMSCALDGETMRCWDHTDPQPWIAKVICPECATPRQLVGDSTSFQYCAIGEDGGVWCHADDTPPITGILDLATDVWHACARLENRIVCWRHLQQEGFLGLGSTRPSTIKSFRPNRSLDPNIPTFDALPAAHVRDLAVVSSSVCILDEAGGLGCHAFPNHEHPTRFGPYVGLTGVGPIEAITVGADMCVLDRWGRIWCWPHDNPPRLGITAQHAIAGIEAARLLAAGPNDSCALLNSGAVSCWPAVKPEWPRECEGAVAEHMPGSPPHPDEIVELVVNACEACVRSRAGVVRCWGVANIDAATGTGVVRTISFD